MPASRRNLTMVSVSPPQRTVVRMQPEVMRGRRNAATAVGTAVSSSVHVNAVADLAHRSTWSSSRSGLPSSGRPSESPRAPPSGPTLTPVRSASRQLIFRDARPGFVSTFTSG
jgi:hypothetical protein